MVVVDVGMTHVVWVLTHLLTLLFGMSSHKEGFEMGMLDPTTASMDNGYLAVSNPALVARDLEEMGDINANNNTKNKKTKPVV